MDEEEQTIINGILYPYYEMGFEGRFDCTVFDNTHKNGRVFFDNLYLLKSGDYLKIFAADNKTLWEGEINFVKRGFLERGFPSDHRLKNVWSYQKQRRVKYRTWMEWFWSKPPLQVELTRIMR